MLEKTSARQIQYICKYAKDGDVVRLMFTLALGTDLMGIDQYANPPQTYYTTADKSALLKRMAEANANKTLWGRVDGFTAAYTDAVNVMAKMNAGQNDVADAVRALTEVKENLPKEPLKGVTLNRDSLTLNPGKTWRLDFSTTPAGGGRYITVDRNGKVTLKKKAPGGTYEITVTAAGNANVNAASRVITVNVTKNKQTVTAKKKSVTYKAKDLKKNKSYAIGGKAKGKITYRVTNVPAGGQGFVTVNKKGKVTVRKGAPKGTYTITLTAAENKEYAAASRTVTVRVK